MQNEANSNKQEASSKTSAKKLPRFWRHHKKFSAVAVTFLVVVLLLFIAQPFISSALANKRSQLLQSQAVILHNLNRIPSPERMVIGQQNADARFVVTQTGQSVKNTIDTIDDLSVPRSYIAIGAIDASTAPADIRALRSSINDLPPAIQADLQAYTDTLEALLRFIEYSPQVDLQEYDPESSDTRERMRRLATGLTKTQESLNIASGNTQNNYVDDLLTVIKEAEAAQSALQDTDDVAAFTVAIPPLQEQAVSILSEYFSSIRQETSKKLIDLNRLIQKTL